MRRSFADLMLGARLALAGGVDSRIRTALTAVGVALGVALLLLASSAPHMVTTHSDRIAARAPASTPAGSRPRLLMLEHDLSDGGNAISGWLVEPTARRPTPLPPGVSRLPGPGQMVVSPALATLLRSAGGTALEHELGNARVVGTIAEQGLSGPAELYVYVGATGLRALPDTEAISGFGQPPSSSIRGPILTLLVIIMVVALLLPIGVFVAVAARFGGSERNRRLAALRLIGADRGCTARVAAGESLLGALLGVVAGLALFFAALRPLIEHIDIAGISVFSSDLRPTPALLALTVVLVPSAAVVFTLASMRQVAVEPLGVTRRGRDPQRRLVWRLLTPAAGFALLAPLIGNGQRVDGSAGTIEASAGVVLVLVGICALLPWLAEAVVIRAGGGRLPWLLAVRRLRADHGTAGRVVGAIGLAVAGAIALQTVFSGADASEQRTMAASTAVSRQLGSGSGQLFEIADAGAGGSDGPLPLTRRLERVPGVQQVLALATVGENSNNPITVAPCAAIRMALSVQSCVSGETFVSSSYSHLRPGERFRAAGRELRLPAGSPLGHFTAPVSITVPIDSVVMTPQVADRLHLGPGLITAMVVPKPGAGGVQQRLDEVMAGLAPLAMVTSISDTAFMHTLRELKNVLTAGAVAVLIVIGFSLLVAVVEQLRERRRVLAVLSAFGTRISTLAWSVLLQTGLLVVIGLTLAVAVGIVLGALLMRILGLPVDLDGGAIALLAGTGFMVVAAVTACTLPMLWLHTRADGLRTE